MMSSESEPKEQTQSSQYASIAPGRPFPSTPGEITSFQVGLFGPDDPELPLNWGFWKKGGVLGLLSYIIMLSAWGSAVAAPATPHLMELYHVGLPVATLSISLYVVGFAVGPVVWGPLSEKLGRKPPLFVGVFGFTLFMFAGATAKDLQTILLSRFFQGTFGAAAIAIGPAIAGDVFTAHTRGIAMSLVSFGVVSGPMIAPVVGAYIAQSFLGWRWTMYITGIMGALGMFMCVIMPETYAGKILITRAARIREETGNWAIHAPGEQGSASFGELAERLVLKPMKMLAREPILLLVSLYHGFIYGILYLCLEAVPIIWEGYGWPGANVYLPYLALMIGSALVNILNVFTFEPWYNRQLEKHNKKVMPENRLPLMIMCGGFFCIGIFWMCWTGAYPKHVHWLAPLFGAGVLGFGMIGLFVAAFNYILDTYLMQSGSAFAANTFLRSAFGCAFPLFAHPMFINLGIQWAGTLLGCLAALLFPVPILFYMFGARIRSMSKYALNLDDLQMGEAMNEPSETGPGADACDSESDKGSAAIEA